MALEITGMTRSFTFKKGSGMITLDDPNPSDSPEMVMSYYSNFYPELTTAKSCVPLDEHQSALLARLIIGQTERNVRHGVNRTERITAPSGAVILF